MAKKHKVLMLVKNLSVPADPRVWREAHTLQRQGFQVCIICPRGETNELNDRSTMLKTLEYMAMGKPVVAFDLPETRHSAKIELLLNDEALRLAMGAAGRKRIEEHLSWNRTSTHLALAYQRLFPTMTELAEQPVDQLELPTPTLSAHP